MTSVSAFHASYRFVFESTVVDLQCTGPYAVSNTSAGDAGLFQFEDYMGGTLLQGVSVLWFDPSGFDYGAQ